MPFTFGTLHLASSATGCVQRLVTFEKGTGLQALVECGNVQTVQAVRAWPLMCWSARLPPPAMLHFSS